MDMSVGKDVAVSFLFSLHGEKWQFLGQLNNSLYCRDSRRQLNMTGNILKLDSAPSGGRCWEEDRVKARRGRRRDFGGHLLHSAASPLLLYLPNSICFTACLRVL